MTPAPHGRRRVLLADDCPAVRQSVRTLLERDYFDVVGEAGDGCEAVRMAAALHPDIVVLDHAMPHAGGFQAAHEISRLSDHPCMILLTIHVAAHHVVQGMQVGIRGFVSKRDAADELVRAVTEVSRGNTFLSTSASRAMLDAQVIDPGTTPPSTV